MRRALLLAGEELDACLYACDPANIENQGEA